PRGACACWRRRRRSARGRTPCSPRSPPTRSACPTTRSTWRSRIRRTCPTAARRSRRARSPSWASSSRRRRATSRRRWRRAAGRGGGAATAAPLPRHGPLRAVAEYLQPPYVSWDETTFRGDAYGAFSWAVYVAQVTVDTVTFEARVEDFVAVQEVGRVMHPVL